MEVSKIAKNIEEEGVNYISTSLDLLDIVAEYLELDVEEISAEDLKDVVLAKFEVIDILTKEIDILTEDQDCLLYTSPSPRDQRGSRMPSSA